MFIIPIYQLGKHCQNRVPEPNTNLMTQISSEIFYCLDRLFSKKLYKFAEDSVYRCRDSLSEFNILLIFDGKSVKGCY